MNDDSLMMYDVKVANPSRGCPMMFFAPSTAHGRGTVSSPASAAATELILLRRSYSCARRPSPLELPPRPSSRWCQQHLEEGRDEDDQFSARL